jgi:hypothetical protein
VSASVAIFGSCVSRDLFEDPRLRPAVSVYAARSSVISSVSEPVEIDPARVRLDSDWQRRCVLADFGKTFFASLREAPPDWLVIDLIHERFDLLRTGGSLVTRSSAFQAAGLDAAEDFGFEPLRRMSPEGDRLFAEAAGAFAGRLVELVPAERVILHRALWCDRYRDGADVLPFAGQRRQLCDAQNAMLVRGYDALDRAFGGRAHTLRPTEALADAGHRWQLEPFHYDAPTNGWLTERLLERVAA